MVEGPGFEIDFLAVGEGTRNGDAIAMRFGTPGNYKIMVYDGGTKDSGRALVNHIRTHYQSNRVDYVVNSHPDQDHASGLSIVLEELEVGELWLHQPWKYSKEICDYFHDGRITDNSLAARLQEKMAAAYQLELLAEEKEIPVREPFAGAYVGDYFRILSPNRDWYVHTLIQEFEKSPEQKKSDGAAYDGLSGLFKSLYEKALEWVDTTWDMETLKEDVSTSAENESSVVLYAEIAGKGILITGDAGVRALSAAAVDAESAGLNLPASIKVAQVPHHGSRNNVSTTVMNRLFGVPNDSGSDRTRAAISSVGAKCETHPRKMVSNAFYRRGFANVKTQGSAIRYHWNMPVRDGWANPVPHIPYSNQEEAW